MSKINRLPFASAKTTLKDQILSYLSETYPLSAKEIYQFVKKEGREITYQGVHKTIKLLNSEGVIEKINSKYQISKNWIDSIREFGDYIDARYTGKNTNVRLPKNFKKPITIHYSSLSDFCVSLVRILASEEITEGKNVPFFALLDHGLWPLKIKFSDLELLRKADGPNPDNRVIIASETSFDKWISKNYDMIGNWQDKSIIGLKGVKIDEDIIVKNGFIFQISYSDKTKKFMNEIYPKIGGLQDIFTMYFFNRENDENLDIELTISRNPQMARIIVEKIKSYFGE